MVSVTVSPAGKPISIAPGLPSRLDIAGKQVQDVTIGDVKAAIAKKFPKVSLSLLCSYLRYNLGHVPVLPRPSKNHIERQQKYSQ